MQALILALLWDEVVTEAVLHRDGRLTIVQQFSSAEARNLRIGLELAGLDSIVEVSLEADGTRIEADREARGRVLWIRSSRSARVFHLRYTIVGVMSGDEFAWKILSEFRDFAVSTARLALTLPSDFDPAKLPVTLQTGAKASEWKLQGNKLDCIARDLTPASIFRLHIHFPPGSVESPIHVNKLLKQQGGTALLLGLPIATLILMLILFWFRGRDPRASDAVTDPAPMAAAIEGTLLDEHADAPELVATLLELAGRGLLQATGSEGELRLKLLAVPALRPYEVSTLKTLFADLAVGAETVLPSEPRRDSVQAALDEIYRECVSRGFFGSHPGRERWMYRAAGALLGALGAVGILISGLPLGGLAVAMLSLAVPMACFVAAARSERSSMALGASLSGATLLIGGLFVLVPLLGAVGFSWPAKVGIGLGLSGLAVFAFAPLMPRLTAAGSEAKIRIYSHRREIERGEGDFLVELPYAVAFRLKKQWIHAAPQAALPSWWTGPAQREDFLRALGILSAHYGRAASFSGGG